MLNYISRKASCFVFLLVVLMLAANVASAQVAQPDNNVEQAAGQLTSIVTASATAERVRFTSPNTVVQLRLEVYDEAGQKLLDTEQRGGNVLDWHLQGSAGERVADGVYLCVVTIKNLSGRLNQKLGLVTVSGQSTVVRSAAVAELGLRQAQSVGPVEVGEAGLTVMSAEDTQPVTVLANNGNEAQLTRTRGALSLRVGDFFSGNDREQMRLTEEGNLGIGTDKPRAKLDVAGVIRTSKGIEFENGTKLTTTATGSLQQTLADGTVVPNAAGTGTQNQIAKWTETGGAGTLGDSSVTEVGGLVGLGTPSPLTNLHVNQPVGAGTSKGLFLSGDEFFQSGNGASNAGILLLLGVNRPGNRQLWIGDRSSLGSTTGGFFRIQSGVYNSMDAVTGNGMTRLPLNLGTPTTNVGVGFNDFNAGGPGAKLDVLGNINTSTQYNIGGNRVLSVTGAGSFLNSNTFAGAGAGAANTPSGTTANGNNNSFFGFNAGAANTNAFSNSLFGRQAGFNNTLGIGNSFFGDNAGLRMTGDNNSFFGRSTGDSTTTGGQNSLFGAFADSADGLTNATAIGFRAFVAQSNSLVLGGISGVNAGTDTKVGIGTTTPAKHLHIVGAGDQEIAIESSDSGGRQWTLQSSKGTSSGRFEIVDRTAGVSRLTIDSSSGGVGINTTNPHNPLHVVGFGPILFASGAPAPEDNIALIEDALAGGSGRAVLGIKIPVQSNPVASDNFITFYKADNTSVGAIEGNFFGGVSLVGAGSDYAEWLPRLNSAEKIQPGEIVGLYGGQITKNTRGAAQVMAVSTGPIVAGNDPGKEARGKYALVAFIGQVMTRVRGSVHAGDFIVASGLNDGTGIAVSPERITSEQFEQVVGQAWETSVDAGVKSVRMAVGLIRRDPTVRRLLEYSRDQADRIGALDARLTALEAQLTSKTARTSPRPVTRKKHRLVARLTDVGAVRSVRTGPGTIR